MPEHFTFTTCERDGRWHIFRNGEACGSVMGYATRADACEAIAETRRFDSAMGTQR